MTHSQVACVQSGFRVTSDIVNSDVSTLTGGNDAIIGSTQDDLLIDDACIDVFHGGAGNDTADYSDNFLALNVQLNNGSLAGTVSSGGSRELHFLVENIISTNANDTFAGNDESNTFEGGGGNDTVDGEGGTDIVSYANATSGVTVDLAISRIGHAIGDGQGTDQLDSVEGVIGSAFNDTIFGGSANDSVQGGAGDDILLTGSRTTSFPFPGTDTIEGSSGNDTIGFALVVTVLPRRPWIDLDRLDPDL
ncbi:hypothetical protein [uncultured Tateyamaria sp.]|uniref:calcium-binding protein n=1 Tax=uncultured Tateyamaria sp. TaxID=455651 RepID=UPI00262C70B6|nr:hypothetical protein [uncultured Tateyamaria sp.]